MLDLEINDMTCGHCVAAITKAVQEASPGAVVDIELSRHRVQVNGASDPAAVVAAIREAGYLPVLKS